MRKLISATCLVVVFLNAFGIAFGGEKIDVEKKVREGMVKFFKEICSKDEKMRKAAFDRVMVDKALMKKLFGKDYLLVWPAMDETLKRRRKQTAGMKKELDAKGAITEIKFTNVRKTDLSGRYRRVLKMIPPEVVVFTSVIEREGRSGGSSSYLLVDGTMRWFPGLESIAERILKKRSLTSKTVDVFEDLSKKFLAALRSEKLDDAMNCWVNVEEMFEFAKNPPKGFPNVSDAELKEMREYFVKRDAVIKKWFPHLIKLLKKKVNLKELKYSSSKGAIRKRGSFEKTSEISMVFVHQDGSSVEVRIDDGLKCKGVWKFSDKPIDTLLKKDGKSEHLNIEE
jgi:hypothetical protein